MEIPRILIVDDEPNVRFILEQTLRHEGYQLETAGDGAEAIRKIQETSYDLLLLDISMKPVNGIHVLNKARENDPDIIAIILTAHSSIESAVDALRLGAFDYLFKPAEPEVIRKRVSEGLHHRQQSIKRKTLLHKVESLRQTLVGLDGDEEVFKPVQTSPRFVQSDKLVIDKHHRSATLNGSLLELTTTEFDILTCLVEAAPRPVTARQLVNDTLNYDPSESEASEIIKYHIHKLRQKVEPDTDKPILIKTVRYKGYMWSGG